RFSRDWSSDVCSSDLLSTYSGKKLKDYRKLFDDTLNSEDLKELFILSNYNPRDLIHIFKILFEEQFRLNPDSSRIGQEAVTKGLKRYVLDFNYYEYYPRKS